MTFTFDLTALSVVLLSISFIASLYLTTVYRSFILRPSKAACAPAREPSSALPGVSVVIYCRDNAGQLRRLLDSVLNQNYGGGLYEVIVVNDGSSEDVKDVVNLLSASHRNLYITFIPRQAHNLSRRKLAMTLGVKAARHPYVVFTNADAVIDSADWLLSMARPFADGAEVVIGNSSDLKRSRGFVSFDQLADSVTWLSGALGGHPHRCSNYNWGFRRELFFENKGFSSSLNLHQGDDDIFFSEIACGRDVSVVLCDESVVRRDIYNPLKIHRLSKLSHIFTGKRVSGRSRLMMASGSWAIWIWLLSTALCVATTVPDMTATAVVAVISLTMLTVMAFAWRRVSAALSVRLCWWLSPLFMLWRPVYNFGYKVAARLSRERNYTWA